MIDILISKQRLKILIRGPFLLEGWIQLLSLTPVFLFALVICSFFPILFAFFAFHLNNILMQEERISITIYTRGIFFYYRRNDKSDKFKFFSKKWSFIIFSESLDNSISKYNFKIKKIKKNTYYKKERKISNFFLIKISKKKN